MTVARKSLSRLSNMIRSERPNPDRAVRLLLILIVCYALAIILDGCSPRIIERMVVQHDTTKVVKVDSIWKYERDSVFVKEKGDTVFKYVEKIRYRDRYKVDTLVKVKVDSVTVERFNEVKVEKPLSWWKSFKLDAFWWLLATVLVLLAWTFRKTLLKLLAL